MTYAYLAASLPTLVFGAPPPFDMAEFRRMCRGLLAAGDEKTLDALLDDRPAGGVAFVDGWRARETQLRNAAARARAARLGVETRPWLREHPGWDVELQAAVADAFAKPNPLEREMALDRIRWRAAEDMARFEPFALDAVLAFAIKLRICWRWAGLDEARGRARVEAFVAGAGSKAETDEAERE